MSEGAVSTSTTTATSSSVSSASPSPSSAPPSTPPPYRDYASDQPGPSGRLSDGEIMGWYHAHVATESAGLAAGGIRGLNSFPGRLYRMLSHPEFSSIIQWMDHGRAWKVLHPRAFAGHVLPRFNGITKYSNFVRQVNSWGFRRIGRGRDEGCYYHEMFLRGRPHLVGRMKRPKGPKPRSASAGGDAAPDFYAMTWLPVEEEGQQPGAGVLRAPSPIGSGAGGIHGPPQAQNAPLPGPANPTAALPRGIDAAQVQQGLHGAVAATMERHLKQAQQLQRQFSEIQAAGARHLLTLNINATVNFNFGGKASCQSAGESRRSNIAIQGLVGAQPAQRQPQLRQFAAARSPDASCAAAPSIIPNQNQRPESMAAHCGVPAPTAVDSKVEDDVSDDDSFVDPFEDEEEECVGDNGGNCAKAAAKVPDKTGSSALTVAVAAPAPVLMPFPPMLAIAPPNFRAQTKPGSWNCYNQLL